MSITGEARVEVVEVEGVKRLRVKEDCAAGDVLFSIPADAVVTVSVELASQGGDGKSAEDNLARTLLKLRAEKDARVDGVCTLVTR